MTSGGAILMQAPLAPAYFYLGYFRPHHEARLVLTEHIHGTTRDFPAHLAALSCHFASQTGFGAFGR